MKWNTALWLCNWRDLWVDVYLQLVIFQSANTTKNCVMFVHNCLSRPHGNLIDRTRINFYSGSPEYKILRQFAKRSTVQHIYTRTRVNNNRNHRVANSYGNSCRLLGVANREQIFVIREFMFGSHIPKSILVRRNIPWPCSFFSSFRRTFANSSKVSLLSTVPTLFSDCRTWRIFRAMARTTATETHTLFGAFVLAAWILRLLRTFLSPSSVLALRITSNLVDMLRRLFRICFY